MDTPIRPITDAELIHALIRHKLASDRQLNPTDRLTKDLGLQPIQVLELVLNIEREFNIDCDDAHAEKVKTVQDCIDLVAKATAA